MRIARVGAVMAPPSARQALHELRDLPVPLARLELKGRRVLAGDADEHMTASSREPDRLRAAPLGRQPELAAEELFRRRERRIRGKRRRRLVAHRWPP